VLDTQAVISWVAHPELVLALGPSEDRPRNGGPAFTFPRSGCWEIALLARKQRLALTLDVADWIAKTEALPCPATATPSTSGNPGPLSECLFDHRGQTVAIGSEERRYVEERLRPPTL
jgi:hypothetical protein